MNSKPILRSVLLMLSIVYFTNCSGQNGQFVFTETKFEEQLLKYEPAKSAEISQENFDYAIMILDETKKSVGSDPDNFNLADYFNVLSAFLTLEESENNIHLAFDKMKNAEGSCEYIVHFKKSFTENPKYKPIREKYDKALANCQGQVVEEKPFSLEDYCAEHKLDKDLVNLMQAISEADRRYRSDSYEDHINKQQQLDQSNQVMVDSLYEVYNTYIGRSLVGPKFETVMWAVVQHSNVEMMERYLELMQRAVQEKRLDVGPLKMTIDRYYGLSYGYQIFGTQQGFGFTLADEKTRNQIMEKYEIR